MLKAPMLLAAVLVVCVASSADARRRHHGYYGYYGERGQSNVDDWRRGRDAQSQGVSPTLDARSLFNSTLRIGKSLAVWKLQYRCASLSSCQSAACCLVQARETAAGIVVIDIAAVLDYADAINNLAGQIEFER